MRNTINTTTPAITVTRPLTEDEKRNRVIRRLLRQHETEWFENDDGTPVMVVQCSTFHKDHQSPLYGTITWHVELYELHTIRETMALLGY